MITMRLRKLIESKCDELAIRFCRRALKAIRGCDNMHPLRQTVSVRHHQTILETYFSLLVKYKKLNELKQELESIDFDSMDEFILNNINTISTNAENSKREKCSLIEQENVSHQIFESSSRTNSLVTSQSQAVPSTSSSVTNTKCISSEQIQFNRLHKYLIKVNEFALQLFVLRILSDSQFTEKTHRATLEKFLTLWIDQHKHESNFDNLFTKLIANSRTRLQMYISCEILFNHVSACV